MDWITKRQREAGRVAIPVKPVKTIDLDRKAGGQVKINYSARHDSALIREYRKDSQEAFWEALRV